MKNEVIELVLQETLTEQEKPEVRRNPGTEGVTVGVFADLNESGEPLVDFTENTSGVPIAARTMVALSRDQIGREAVLMFERGDLSKPIIAGLLHHQNTKQSNSAPAIIPASHRDREAQVDGETLVLTAEREIVLRCGEASITLHRNGRVIIRGMYVESRSKGTNRIKGGAVLIN